ncbi:MAG: hypothetical protein LBI94_01725, partial [Treponema sp.]|nr:hypothetical protein [Treponema sp.]
MKKSQLFGLLAALTAVVIFTGCPTDPDIEYRDKIVEKEKIVEKDKIIDNDVMIHIDTLAENQAGLVAALANPAYEDKVIGYDGSTALASESVTIGEKYAVYILNGGDLATGSGAGLTVEGTLWVGYGAALTVGDSSEPIVVDGGVVNVVTGGTLSIDSADSIQDAEGETALGTAAVSIVNGKLAYTDGSGFDTTTKIAAALGYITSGTLDVGEVELKPSEVTGITIPQNKSLIANTGDTDETATTLIIPAGLVLTTGDDLDSVTELTVYGTLTASSATLKSDGAALTVGANGSASIGAATLLTSTVEGSLTLNGDLTLDTDAVLTITAQAELSGSDKIIAAAGTITIVAEGVSYEGFTTDDTGVAADDFWTVAEALQADLNALTGDKTA